MKHWLPVVALIAACSGDRATGTTSTTPSPVRFVIVVDGSQTGVPGPYCVVRLSSPALLTLQSRPNRTDSAVATLNVAPGRYPASWQVDEYDAGGFWATTVTSQPNDSAYVPGSAYFVC